MRKGLNVSMGSTASITFSLKHLKLPNVKESFLLSTHGLFIGTYMIINGNDNVLLHLILSVNSKIHLKSEKFKSIDKSMR